MDDSEAADQLRLWACLGLLAHRNHLRLDWYAWRRQWKRLVARCNRPAR